MDKTAKIVTDLSSKVRKNLLFFVALVIRSLTLEEVDGKR